MTLQEWIARNHMSRPEAMRKLGVRSSGHLADLERGRFWPSRAMMERIFEVTGGKVTPTDFLPESRPRQAAGR